MKLTSNNKSAVLSVAILLVAMLSIQSGATLAKTLFPVIGAEGLTALRLGIGSILITGFLRPWRHWHKWHFTKKNVLNLLIYGIVLGCMNLSFYMAVERIPLGIAVALEFTGPLAVAILSSRKAVDFLWLIFAVTGLYFLLPISSSSSDIDPTGAMYALCAGFFWALYIIFGKRAGSVFGTQAASLGSIIGAIIIFPVGVAEKGIALFDPALLPFALGVALLSTAIPYSLEMKALTKLPMKTFGTLMSLEPAIGALCGMVFLSEMLSAGQWLSIAAIIFASIGATLSVRNTGEVVSISTTESDKMAEQADIQPHEEINDACRHH